MSRIRLFRKKPFHIIKREFRQKREGHKLHRKNQWYKIYNSYTEEQKAKVWEKHMMILARKLCRPLRVAIEYESIARKIFYVH